MTADLITFAVCLITALWVIRRLGRWITSSQISAAGIRTIAAITVPTAVSIQGMYGVARDTLGWPIYMAAGLCAFIEIVMYDRAMAARQTMLDDPEHGRPGVDGAAVWVLTSLSALLSTMHAQSFSEAVARIIAPYVAAFSWHRYLKAAQQGKREKKTRLTGINWRLTPERVLVRLGLADPTGRTAGQVSVERTLTTLAIAARRADTDSRPFGWWHKRRRRAALQRALEYGRLGVDPASQVRLVNALAVLNGGESLSTLRPTAPWESTGSTGVDLEDAYRDLIERGVVEVDDRTRVAFGLSATDVDRPRPGYSPARLHLVDHAPAPRAIEASPDRDTDGPTGTNRPGQAHDADPMATVVSTIRRWNDQGVGEERIALELGVSRYWVRKTLGREGQPGSTGINGHAVGADQ